ncbi:MAG: hypothetical protein Q7S83_04215 [bacterium]|nr:hypothetical protein [bacterium]
MWIRSVLQIIVFSSLGLVIYMIARAIPRVPEEVSTHRRSSWVDRLMSKIPMSAIDDRLNSFIAKFLRKFRVIMMKIDNFINDRLGKLSKKTKEPTEESPSQDQNKTVL